MLESVTAHITVNLTLPTLEIQNQYLLAPGKETVPSHGPNRSHVEFSLPRPSASWTRNLWSLVIHVHRILHGKHKNVCVLRNNLMAVCILHYVIRTSLAHGWVVWFNISTLNWTIFFCVLWINIRATSHRICISEFPKLQLHAHVIVYASKHFSVRYSKQWRANYEHHKSSTPIPLYHRTKSLLTACVQFPPPAWHITWYIPLYSKMALASFSGVKDNFPVVASLITAFTTWYVGQLGSTFAAVHSSGIAPTCVQRRSTPIKSVFRNLIMKNVSVASAMVGTQFQKYVCCELVLVLNWTRILLSCMGRQPMSCHGSTALNTWGLFTMGYLILSMSLFSTFIRIEFYFPQNRKVWS